MGYTFGAFTYQKQFLMWIWNFEHNKPPYLFSNQTLILWPICYCFLLLHNKLPQIQQFESVSIFSHDVCRNPNTADLKSSLHQDYKFEMEVLAGLPFLEARVLFGAHVIVGRILLLVSVELRPYPLFYCNSEAALKLQDVPPGSWPHGPLHRPSPFH